MVKKLKTNKHVNTLFDLLYNQETKFENKKKFKQIIKLH